MFLYNTSFSLIHHIYNPLNDNYTIIEYNNNIIE